MRFLVSINGQCYRTLKDDSSTIDIDKDTVVIQQAGTLLELYVATDDDSALMDCLQEIRNKFLADLDSVNSIAEIMGLISWLLRDYQIDNRGESLEQTAERLSDMDSAGNSDTQRKLLYHLHDAIERIDDLTL